MEILGKLFGTTARVKIMRLFLLNDDQDFDIDDIVSRSKISKVLARKEVNALIGAGFLRKKIFTKKSISNSKKQKKVNGFCLEQNFPYRSSLEKMLVKDSSVNRKELITRFKTVGKISFLAVSGVFTNDEKSRVDMLIVGDKIKKDSFSKLIGSLESEIGKELVYALFDTKEFFYRLGMYDKLVMDVLEYPHERIIDNPLLSTVKVTMSE